MTFTEAAIRLGEALPWPDSVSAAVISHLVERTRRSLAQSSNRSDATFSRAIAALPVAINTTEANNQHYEIPARFFEMILGPQRKYSCCYYGDARDTLVQAEERALEMTAEHARLADGQQVLELGCGWGSLSLWMARRYPNSRIISVSNSASQREFILRQAAAADIPNLAVVTADMNAFVPQGDFDRIVSVEMFEHMVNWRPLLNRMRAALRPDGLLFLHVFTHKSGSYRFSPENRADWISQHFFTGGIMPSHGLIRQYQDIFSLDAEWQWNGRHYEKTARDWLANYDRHRTEIFEVLRQIYGKDARLWQRRWRLFFLATMGLFGHAGGDEWGVSHYLLSPSRSA
ncbi:cyclopropane-fatty-acyl-phospholipid synthase family protein [Bradyrhizobium sp. CCGB20]|uniref:SAM-dependent methyltransferase n=1 Tax=Bradyrhizobium sp. CCGB20 TaxID=2949633 RepID=UPI0020B1B787|nr:cyclopropane-fatty-acyl-phospholipid synthase family protein [Bradyrhizobium sp. CCGB20]MCP3400288.1 cyclopropane-fatty-acyl-phospholipid synthase family protein [Bradyrhizobium sp. CCGB20]